MTLRKTRTVEELRKASDHLFYEIWMLQSLARGMASGVFGEGPANNAVLESFVVHVRNLIYFLFAEKPKGDHVVAADFFDSQDVWEAIQPEKTDLIKASEIRAHKEVAHLSYDRIKVTPEAKPWNFLAIEREITAAFNAFLSSVPTEFLGKRWEQTLENMKRT
jgi:hypothetical protein